MLTGRRPEGLASPKSNDAIALPPCSPGYHAVSRASALSAAWFIRSVLPWIYTTTSGLPVFFVAALTAAMSCSCLPRRSRVERSNPSPQSMSSTSFEAMAAPVAIYLVRKSRALEPPTTNTTASALSAALTAAGMSAEVVSRTAQPLAYTTSVCLSTAALTPSSTVTIASRACGAV